MMPSYKLVEKNSEPVYSADGEKMIAIRITTKYVCTVEYDSDPNPVQPSTDLRCRDAIGLGKENCLCTGCVLTRERMERPLHPDHIR